MRLVGNAQQIHPGRARRVPPRDVDAGARPRRITVDLLDDRDPPGVPVFTHGRDVNEAAF